LHIIPAQVCQAPCEIVHKIDNSRHTRNKKIALGGPSSHYADRAAIFSNKAPSRGRAPLYLFIYRPFAVFCFFFSFLFFFFLFFPPPPLFFFFFSPLLLPIPRPAFGGGREATNRPGLRRPRPRTRPRAAEGGAEPRRRRWCSHAPTRVVRRGPPAARTAPRRVGAPRPPGRRDYAARR